MRDNTYYLFCSKLILWTLLLSCPVSLCAFQYQKDTPSGSINLSLDEDIIRFEYEVSKSLVINLIDIELDESYTVDYTLIRGTVDVQMLLDNKEKVIAKFGSFGFQNRKSAKLVFENRGKKDAKIVLSVIKNRMPIPSTRMMSVLSVDHSPTVNFLVEDVFIGGDCYDVSAVDYKGHGLSRGTFGNGAKNIGFSNGVILGTGYISNAPGPNNSSKATSQTNTSGDNDLRALANNAPVYDASVLEFDFVPTTDTVKFRYVFASEEYCDYSNSNFNDVFGFFLSGPGIAGPYSNNAINIAKLPSGQNVTINNVNHVNNPEYYISNTTESTNTGYRCTGNPLGSEPSISELQYDAFTVILEAVAIVQPCENYHIKLAVGDVYDRKFDSAVFLESNSFISGDQIQASVINQNTGENFSYEGCEPLFYEFCRVSGANNSEPLVVNYSIDNSSTATPGEDYDVFPLSVTIPSGSDCISVPISLIDDGVTEGNETIILNLEQSCSCLNDELLLEIKDKPQFELSVNNAEICPGDFTVLSANAFGGGASVYEYLWSTGEKTKDITVNPAETSVYSVTVTDVCGEFIQKESMVAVNELPHAFLSGSGSICSDQSNDVNLVVDFIGSGPWELTYSKDGIEQLPITTSESSYNLIVNEPGLYTITSVKEQGKTCLGSVNGSIQVGQTVLSADIATINPICFGANTGSITVSMSGGEAPYSFTWSNNDASGNTPTNLSSGIYEVTITDNNGCQFFGSETLSAPDEIDAQINDIVNIDCNNSLGSASVSASGGTNNFNFDWSNGVSGAVLNVSSAGNFEVTITDDNGCTEERIATITIDTAAVVELSSDNFELDCSNTSTQIVGSTVNTDHELVYQWTTSDGQIVSGEDEIDPVVSEGGTYILEVYNSSNGCSHESSVFVDEDFEVPTVNAGSNKVLNCSLTELYLEGSTSEVGSSFLYNWTTLNGTIESGAETLTPLISAPGTYNIKITNLDSGCSSTADVEVFENIAVPTFSVNADVEILNCSKTTSVLSYSLGENYDDYSIAWADVFGDPILAVANATSVNVDAEGTYSVLLTDNTNGCSSTEYITISQDIEEPVAVAVAMDKLSCANQTITIDGGGSNEGSEFSYSWENPSGVLMDGETNLSLSAENTGLHTLFVTNTETGCVGSAQVLVEIDTLLPDVSSLVNGQLDCKTAEVMLTTTVSNADQLVYEWIDPDGVALNEETSTLMVSTAGAYTVMVENVSNGCVGTANVVVGQDFSAPQLSAEPSADLTCTVTSRTLELINSSTSGTFEYDWSTIDGNILSGSQSLKPIVDAPGIYTVNVLNTVNGCEELLSLELGQDITAPEVIIQNTDLITCALSAIEIDATASSSGSNFIYEWTTVEGSFVSGTDTPRPRVDEVGDYTLLVTNTANGCVNESVVTIDQDIEEPVAAAVAMDKLSCANQTITIDGGGSNEGSEFSYSWESPFGVLMDGETNLSLSAENTGLHTLFVTNTETGCVGSAQVLVEIDTLLPDVSSLVNGQLDCKTAEVMLTTTVSNADQLVYEWIDPDGVALNEETSTLMVSAAGAYTVLVENVSNGCVGTANVVVGQDFSAPQLSAEPTADLTCAVTSRTLELINSSTSGTFEYDWSTSDGNILSGSQSLKPIVDAPGIYTVNVLNTVNGCEELLSLELGQDITVPEVIIQNTDLITCAVSAIEIDATASSSGSNFVYEWTTVEGSFVSGTDTARPMVDEVGAYTLLITDTANGCVNESVVTVDQDIEEPVAVVSNIQKLNCDLTAVTLSGSDSEGTNLQYKWINSVTDELLSESSEFIVEQPGFYSLFVRNLDNGCNHSINVELEQDITPPNAELLVSDILTCSNTTVNLNSAISTESGSFELLWYDVSGTLLEEETTETIQVEEPGLYTLYVSDPENGCIAEFSAAVEEDTEVPNVELEEVSKLTCSVEEVMLEANTSSTSNDLAFWWTVLDGNIQGDPQMSTLTVSEAGMYSFEAIDLSSGCSNQITVIVEEDLDPPTAILNGNDLLTCDLLELELSGMDSEGDDLTFRWLNEYAGLVLSESPIFLTQDVGAFVLEVIDQTNGCIDELEFIVEENIESPDVEILETDLLTCSTTKVLIETDITTVNLDPSLNYMWYSGSSLLQSGLQSNYETSLAGNYKLLVEDLDNGCVSEQEFQVFEDVSVPEVYVEEPEKIDCNTDEVELDVTVFGVSGGDFTFEWLTSGNTIVNPNVLDAIVNSAGTFELLVINTLNDCPASLTVEVEGDFVYPEVDAGVDFMFPCFEEFVSLDANVQLPSNEFSVEWNTLDGNIISGITSLSPEISSGGTYTIQVVDNTNGCVSSDEIRVENDIPYPIDVEEVQPLCADDLGVISISESSLASGPFVYSINGGESFVPESNFYNLSSGNYQVVMQDLNGCWSEVNEVELINPEKLVVESDSEIFLEQGESVLLNVQTNYPFNEISTVEWYPSEGLDCSDCLSPLFEGNSTRTYQVKVTTLNGCVENALVTIYVDQTPKVFIPNVFTPEGESNDIFMITADPKIVELVKSFEIFDRWGEKMLCLEYFKPNDPAFGWDGVFKGRTCDPGVFIYSAEIIMKDGRIERYKGDLTITK